MQRHTTPLTPARRGGPSGVEPGPEPLTAKPGVEIPPRSPWASPQPPPRGAGAAGDQTPEAGRAPPLPASQLPPAPWPRLQALTQAPAKPCAGKVPLICGPACGQAEEGRARPPVATRHPRQPPGLAHLGGLPGLASEATMAPAVQRAGEEGTGGWGGGRRRADKPSPVCG